LRAEGQIENAEERREERDVEGDGADGFEQFTDLAIPSRKSYSEQCCGS
jgi:hypothetical protein